MNEILPYFVGSGRYFTFYTWILFLCCRQIEGKVVEISRLQEIFADKVLEQVWTNNMELLALNEQYNANHRKNMTSIIYYLFPCV